MGKLEEFERQLRERVEAAATMPQWPASDVERYMAAFRQRRQRFDETAQSLIASVVRPRLEALERLFPSARISPDRQYHCCSCWFPASWSTGLPTPAG